MAEPTNGGSGPTRGSRPELGVREDAVTFTLDGRRVSAHPHETIWLAAKRYGVTMPHACLSRAPDFRPEGNCRLCVVEIEGYRTLQPSCLMKVSEGLLLIAMRQSIDQETSLGFLRAARIRCARLRCGRSSISPPRRTAPAAELWEKAEITRSAQRRSSLLGEKTRLMCSI